MGLLVTYLSQILGWLIRLCNQLTSNYFLVIISFTLLSKIVMWPISYYVHKNSVKMMKMQPELNRIKARNILDIDRFYEEQLKVFKEEKYSAFAGILPLVIQVLLIIGIIGVMNNPLTFLTKANPMAIESLKMKTAKQLNTTVDDLGSAPELYIIEAIKDSRIVNGWTLNNDEFEVVEKTKKLDIEFFGSSLTEHPNVLMFSLMWLYPIIAAISSFVLSVFQNKLNVLQREQSFFSKWGMAVFLSLFSLYFGFTVAASLAVYWIASNIFSIIQLLLLNKIYSPNKYIDFIELDKSKRELEEAKKALIPKRGVLDNSEDRKREKTDYKRFFKVKDEDMLLVFYSEQSGFYKYFKGFVEYILANSNIVIHYVTSDSKDVVFSKQSEKLKVYYVGEAKLIYLMMKIKAKIVVMTTPDLQNYHIKRSLVRKDIEYIYIQHSIGSLNMLMRTGSMDHFDTVFAANTHHTEELRLMETQRNTKKKRILKCGYPLLDELIASQTKKEKKDKELPMVLIAPTWSPDNILDSCLDEMLNSLFSINVNIVLRPHPQYIRRFPDNMNAILDKYKNKLSNKFIIETDFSSNETIFSADVLITDWSNIACEFSFSTKRPTLFVNTKLKVVNEEYEELGITPYDISVRNRIGISLEKSQMKDIGKTVISIIENKHDISEKISKELEETIYNIGFSAAVGGNYIINRIYGTKKSSKI